MTLRMGFGALLAALLAPFAVAQTVSGGPIAITFKDAVGGIYTVTVPVSGASVSYVAPPAPVPPPPPPPAPSLIPSTAVKTSLNGLSNWKWEHDAATPGTSSGSSVYPASLSATARQFYMTYTQNAGERWHVAFGVDTAATHFVYDTSVYLTDPAQVQNLELDMNQVMANGQTVIYGVQCSGYSKTWEYTVLKSTGGFGWQASNLPCNPKQWTANTWHHVQIASHRDSSGTVTYDWITLDDGAPAYFSGATGYDAKALGWAVGDLLVNFQIEGGYSTSGSVTAYADKLAVYRW